MAARAGILNDTILTETFLNLTYSELAALTAFYKMATRTNFKPNLF
jgi:hypothetical protein